MADRIEAGNIYVNRNQIGAIVGSQPFGGEGLSGTGPKAGGPLYLDRFRSHPVVQTEPKAAPDEKPSVNPQRVNCGHMTSPKVTIHFWLITFDRNKLKA